MARYNSDYSGGGYHGDRRRENGGYDREMTREEYDQRMAVANRRMEDSSFRCVQLVTDTVDMANNTSEELERQSEALDRTERHADEIEVNLESSKRNMREVKSMWGSMFNRFSKPKYSSDEVPSSSKSKSRSKRSSLPPEPKGRQKQQQYKDTGNEVVDKNLDVLEAGLKQLEGQAYLIGHQIDESSDQVDRIRGKLDRNDIRIQALNRDIKKQL